MAAVIVIPALLGAVLWARRPGTPTDCVRPNQDAGAISVIMIIIDTLRADRLGAYGYARATSPSLDELAETAVLFENAYAQAPNTPPSVASILTSLYPSSHHFTGQGDRLTEDAVTLAEMMQARGYRTGAFVDGGFLSSRFGLSQGFETYVDDDGGFERVLPAAGRWLAENAGAPFFLLLHSYDVHTPYENTPPPYRDTFSRNRYEGDLTSERLEEVRTKKAGRTLTPAETEHFSDLYDGGILHADALLGDFLDDLTADGTLDRSIVIVTADHGEAFMEHGDVLHSNLYRTVTHVPLIVRFPDARAAGMRVRDIVESIDIAPTVLDVVGSQPYEGMQGRSLLATACGHELSEPMAVSELTWNRDRHGYYFADWHMIHDTRAHFTLLFDVAVDPLEQRNVWDLHRREIGDLARRLAARVGDARSRAFLPRHGASRTDELDPDTAESLRALGYLQ
jgi:arylsulfatase A-like enzyme